MPIMTIVVCDRCGLDVPGTVTGAGTIHGGASYIHVCTSTVSYWPSDMHIRKRSFVLCDKCRKNFEDRLDKPEEPKAEDKKFTLEDLIYQVAEQAAMEVVARHQSEDHNQ